jgi:hypothetical protein
MFAKKESKYCSCNRIDWIVLRDMNDMRENGWDPLFEEVKSFCTKMNIVIPNMDGTIPTRGRSRCRGAKLLSSTTASLKDQLSYLDVLLALIQGILLPTLI